MLLDNYLPDGKGITLISNPMLARAAGISALPGEAAVLGKRTGSSASRLQPFAPASEALCNPTGL